MMAGRAAQVGLPTRIGFGVGDFGFLLVWQGTTLFLMYFYTDVLGIDPIVAGAIYLAAMIWDAITDPLIATLADRSNSRWGKYRPWIFFGAIPFGLSYALAFSGTPTQLIAPWLWALITHIILRSAYTVVSMPFSAMQARLTTDGDERAVLAGYRMVGAASGGLAVALLTPSLVAAFGMGDEGRGYFYAACFAGLLAAVGLTYSALTMKEPANAPKSTQTASFWGDLGQLYGLAMRNDQLLRVFGIITVGTICLGMFGKNLLYFFKYDAERMDLITIALLLPAAMLILATPFWVRFAKRTSKRIALRNGLLISAAGYLVFFLTPSTFIPGIMGSIAIIGIGGAALPVMFWSMLPDTVDYGEARVGIRAEARTFGLATFAQKAATGINALLLGLLLSAVGFEANAQQPAETLLGIKSIMALVPLAGAIAILWFLKGYVLDASTHGEIQQSLGRSGLEK